MKHNRQNIHTHNSIIGIGSILMFAFMGIFISAAYADVVERPTATPETPTSSVSRPALNRMPTMSVNTAARANTTTGGATTTTTTTSGGTGDTTTSSSDTTPAPDYYNEVIEDKTDQFAAVVGASATGGVDESATNLAELIRQQRAALDAASAAEFSQQKAQDSSAGLSACDSGLRSCMQEKCGNDYLKCRGDGDTDWGIKLDACRTKTKCKAHEFALFGAEIKADRDMNARLASYQSVIDCGNRYNACIEEQCNPTFNKCLGKKAGDAAIAQCESIARECTQMDSGLASRTMNVFGTLRQDAEKQVRADEQRLYKMRDQMRNLCQRLGAMFDERSLDCVFTVEFWAGGDPATLFASKKAYAGSTFDCDPGWFGVDVTTYKENAYRATREQKAASSEMLGAGLGIAAGAISSGAIDRAIDRQKAKKAVKDAEKEAGLDPKANPDCKGQDDGTECTKRFVGVKTIKGICYQGKCVTQNSYDKHQKGDDDKDNTQAPGGGITLSNDEILSEYDARKTYYINKPSNPDQDWYDKNCGQTTITSGVMQGMKTWKEAEECDKIYYYPECNSFSTNGQGECDFSKMDQATEGSEEKCKRCQNVLKKVGQCITEKKAFCQDVAKKLNK